MNTINGMTRSNAFQLANSRQNHTKKLEQIASTKSSFSFGKSPSREMSQSRKKHATSRSVRNIMASEHVKQENMKMIKSMFSIANRSLNYPVIKQQFKIGKFKQEEARKKKAIETQNKQIASRIVAQKSIFSKQKDRLHYLESREIVKRIQKFALSQRFPTKVSLRGRVHTDPNTDPSDIYDTKIKLVEYLKNVQANKF